MDADLLHSALGSATAGIISRMCTHPLDTAKARLQASGGKAALTYQGPVDVLRKTIRTEGIRGWYRGFGAILVGGTPGTMVYLCSYEMIKKRLSAIHGSSSSSSSTTGASNDESFVVHFASGMLAETIACIVYVPVDVIKERLQVQHQQKNKSSSAPQQQYHGSYDAMRKILQHEGFSGIYKGYGATLLSFGPFSAIYFGLYEFMKKSAREHLLSTRNLSSEDVTKVQDERDFDLPFHWVVGCSSCAGAAASWLTSPLDMAKLRLQVQRGKVATGGKEGQIMYRGMTDALKFAFRDGGMKGLFKGALARVLHFTPATCITMTAYETCKSFYAKILP